jgi:hypothetical protein
MYSHMGVNTEPEGIWSHDVKYGIFSRQHYFLKSLGENFYIKTRRNNAKYTFKIKRLKLNFPLFHIIISGPLEIYVQTARVNYYRALVSHWT